MKKYEYRVIAKIGDLKMKDNEDGRDYTIVGLWFYAQKIFTGSLRIKPLAKIILANNVFVVNKVMHDLSKDQTVLFCSFIPENESAINNIDHAKNIMRNIYDDFKNDGFHVYGEMGFETGNEVDL